MFRVCLNCLRWKLSIAYGRNRFFLYRVPSVTILAYIFGIIYVTRLYCGSTDYIWSGTNEYKPVNHVQTVFGLLCAPKVKKPTILRNFEKKKFFHENITTSPLLQTIGFSGLKCSMCIWYWFQSRFKHCKCCIGN